MDLYWDEKVLLQIRSPPRKKTSLDFGINEKRTLFLKIVQECRGPDKGWKSFLESAAVAYTYNVQKNIQCFLHQAHTGVS